MFMTGFIFGSVLTYMICLEEPQLPIEAKIGIALAAGVLCGLITMLVQQVGFFSIGLNFGVLFAVATLIIMEQFYHPSTKWITIGILFGSALFFAVLCLYFQRGLTILGTAIFGSALMVSALDYYIEMFMMVNYVWDRMKAEYSDPVCWFSWLILSLWPASFIVGVITQWRVTGKDSEHREGKWLQAILLCTLVTPAKEFALVVGRGMATCFCKLKQEFAFSCLGHHFGTLWYRYLRMRVCVRVLQPNLPLCFCVHSPTNSEAARGELGASAHERASRYAALALPPSLPDTPFQR